MFELSVCYNLLKLVLHPVENSFPTNQQHLSFEEDVSRTNLKNHVVTRSDQKLSSFDCMACFKLSDSPTRRNLNLRRHSEVGRERKISVALSSDRKPSSVCNIDELKNQAERNIWNTKPVWSGFSFVPSLFSVTLQKNSLSKCFQSLKVFL